MDFDSNAAINKKLKELEIILPHPIKPIANYVPYKIINHTLYISGQISIKSDGSKIIGKLGKSMSVQEGQEAARMCALNVLAWVDKACHGNLGLVLSINQITVLINSADDFTEHPKVANGASDCFVEIFGKEIGSHTRVAVGVNSLPLGAAIEIAGIFTLAS